MKILKVGAALVIAMTALFSCKTTEANYRAAYEKTVAARDSVEQLENTIYGQERRRMQSATVSTDSGAVEVRRQYVRVTEGGGAMPEQLRRFNVVVAQFKQRFNALSMRERLADGAYPTAFVVETSEPYYYVVAASYADVTEADRALSEIKQAGDIVLRQPCPFILDAAIARKR